MTNWVKVLLISGLGAVFLFAWWRSARAGVAEVALPEGEDAEELRESAKAMVWAGFMKRQEMLEALPEILSVEVSPAALATIVDAELALKREAEKSWPERTDVDRLQQAFVVLRGRGVFALHYAGYTQSDGLEDVSEAIDKDGGKYFGWCFYTAQDVEGLLTDPDRGLWLAFGANNEDGAGAVKAGKVIRKGLEEAGFVTEWDGTVDTRISIPRFDWKRRGNSPAP